MNTSITDEIRYAIYEEYPLCDSDAVIQAMTNLQLLSAIDEALSTILERIIENDNHN